MVVRFVFVDESKAHDFLLVSAALQGSRVAAARKRLRSLTLRGQTRVHMKKESDPRRRQILDDIREIEPELIVYRATNGRTDLVRRARCLARLVRDQPRAVASRLVLERDLTLVDRDRQTIIEASRVDDRGPDLAYEHESASAEPLLAIPDAVAWAWARGGHWRDRVRPMVSNVIDV